ncbi:hypothetical protein [Endozoicomonas sp. 4G]|uniref:hypothetical protein n=1 Tax=Endozoicomonas sp. 4G TaxID=2872754 RepID=UPI00207915A7|nr:hypothetical protein [Endozoicomonas sp. 4G]
MNHHFVYQSRWLFLLVLLFSLQTMATNCDKCGKDKEPGQNGQTLCRTCDSESEEGQACAPEKLPSSGPSSDRMWVAEGKDEEGEEDESALIAEIQLDDKDLDAINKEHGDTFTQGSSQEISQKLLEIANDLMERQQQTQLEIEEQRQKEREMLQKLQQALISAGADQREKQRIHEQIIGLTQQRSMAITQSTWSTDLSGMGLFYLSSADLQNAQLMMDLTGVFQAIQEGDTIQLIITHTQVANEGSQAAAGTITPVLLGAIIPDPDVHSRTRFTNMHLLIGTAPVHVTRNNLMSVLIAAMNTLRENVSTGHLTLHFFLSPQVYSQDNLDFLPPAPDFDPFDRNFPAGDFATD